MPNYIVTIGLEVHVQLKTRSKMFCGCRGRIWCRAEHAHLPVVLGFPGALPVMNHAALRMTVLTGLMLGCDIATRLLVPPEELLLSGHAEELPDQRRTIMPLCTNGSVPLHDLAYPKDAQKSIVTAPRQGRSSRAHPSRGRRGEVLPLRIRDRHRFQSRGNAIDGDRERSPKSNITRGSLRVSDHPAETDPRSMAALSDADMEKGQLRCDCNVGVAQEAQQQSTPRSKSRT